MTVNGVGYAAGDVPEPQHAARITNPRVWQDDDNDTGQDASAPTPLVVADASAPKVARPDEGDTDRRKPTRRP